MISSIFITFLNKLLQMKILSLLAVVSLLLLNSCASVKSADKMEGFGPINPTKQASDSNYGYSEKNPICVGGVIDSNGPA